MHENPVRIFYNWYGDRNITGHWSRIQHFSTASPVGSIVFFYSFNDFFFVLKNTFYSSHKGRLSKSPMWKKNKTFRDTSRQNFPFICLVFFSQAMLLSYGRGATSKTFRNQLFGWTVVATSTYLNATPNWGLNFDVFGGKQCNPGRIEFIRHRCQSFWVRDVDCPSTVFLTVSPA